MAKKIKIRIDPKLLKKKAMKVSSSLGKRCRFCSDENLKKTIDYKNSSLLKVFLIDSGKVLSSRMSGNCHSCQKRLTKEIKLSRIMALIPFCSH